MVSFVAICPTTMTNSLQNVNQRNEITGVVKIHAVCYFKSGFLLRYLHRYKQRACGLLTPHVSVLRVPDEGQGVLAPHLALVATATHHVPVIQQTSVDRRPAQVMARTVAGVGDESVTSDRVIEVLGAMTVACNTKKEDGGLVSDTSILLWTRSIVVRFGLLSVPWDHGAASI